MRSTQPSSRIGLWAALLLALGVLPGWLHAQEVDALPPPPGDAAPALPDFSLDNLKPSGISDQPGKLKGQDKEPKISVTWSPLAGSPETAVVAIRVLLQDGANTYDFQPVPGSKPTKITFDEIAGATPLDASFVADRAPELIDNPTENKPKLREYLHEVTFLRRYQIQGEPAPFINGKIEIQVCRLGCIVYRPELSAEWSSEPYAEAMPAEWNATGSPAAGTPTSTGTTGNGSDASLGIEVVKSAPLSLGYALLLAFIGGVIMNVMPCVLPVIAIKVLSFVQQAGESRSRILALNLAYSVGVIAVFLALGTLATFARIGLGQLFQYDAFNVVMACVVFAMGLSLLGVFEFSLPGSVGGAAHHEGLTGAFFTGILATLLATPCIGPFVGSVVFWSVTQPTVVIYLIWGMLGLGMASPYLLIGLFPSLINRMPRPGMWMVRFKEFSGFVLMATVIFLINNTSPDQLIPTLVILLGIALGLWMIGNLYDHSTPTSQKWTVRVAALVISLPLIGFGALQNIGVESLPWEPFSESRLVELRRTGQPILIDFTADWCAVCKTNERLALNTAKTAEFVKAHKVACLKADYTDESPEITAWLKRFGAAGVPLVVIFPPGENAKGIPFDGIFTQSGLLSTMEEAWQKSGIQAPAQTTSIGDESTRQ